MKVNKSTAGSFTEVTHGGAKAARTNDEQALRRSVLSCLLWEDEHYEDGETISKRIASLVPKVAPAQVAALAKDARSEFKLRHVPLLLIREMCRHNTHRGYVKEALADVVQRADELSEFMAIYWKDGKTPVSNQVKKGLAKAFTKFNEYQLAKYNRDCQVRLRDVLFICHAKPANKEQEAVWQKLIDNELAIPDTWEVALSAGANKKETFTRLINEKKLGVMALLRNIRNMEQAGVDRELVKKAIVSADVERVLPFRFLTAARHNPVYEPALETSMFKCLEGEEKLKGKTILILDVSGSMEQRLSGKSELSRLDAAYALSILAREMCDDVVVYATAGCDWKRIHATDVIPARRGFALAAAGQAMYRKLGGGGIFLKQCMDYVYEKEKSADRIIVFTDEQDCDQKCNPSTANAFGKKNYLINVASARNGIGYGKWHHIDGFSEACIKYIQQYEKFAN